MILVQWRNSETGEWVGDKDGIGWHEAPLPRRWHLCRPQTFGFVSKSYIERCACGGMWTLDGGGWTHKNSRRKK